MTYRVFSAYLAKSTVEKSYFESCDTYVAASKILLRFPQWKKKFYLIIRTTHSKLLGDLLACYCYDQQQGNDYAVSNMNYLITFPKTYFHNH